MKKQPKPLVLNRETVALLEERCLRDAAGLSAAGICSRPCPISLSCPGKIC
jgi:hypothetical protein